MPSTYPGALDNIPANKSDTTVAAGDHAPHHNALADAVNAVQTALGVNLANVAAAAAPVQSVAGRTGAVTLAKGDVGLGNVDNTSDADKPVSTATQTALNGKANTSHTHVAADVTDFSTAADARIAASDKVSSNTTGVTGADAITNMLSLTQAEYDAITPNASTFYVIVG
jgi:hypothetical protein